MKIRTDMADEAVELLSRDTELEGVTCRSGKSEGLRVTRVEITDKRGSEAVGKPEGRYVTIYLDGLARREEDVFSRAVRALSGELRALLPEEGRGGRAPVLVAGLGNRFITPDAIGPKTVESVMVTRHLAEYEPESFGSFRPVAAVSPGVLGITGIETGEILRGVTDRCKPAFVIAVDALASGSLDRLCTTVQIADTGIVPGSGIGNRRNAVNSETLGLPVIAVGVPTVVDAATIAADLRGEESAPPSSEKRYENMIVTPKDIDSHISDIAKVVGYAINLTLHENLTIEDVDLYLS